jgi:hypothetical protein
MTENPNANAANQGKSTSPGGAPLFLIHNTTNIRFSARRKKKCEALSPPTAVDARGLTWYIGVLKDSNICFQNQGLVWMPRVIEGTLQTSFF